MDQSRALNALAPFLALAKSATSPRAAADLITQATSAPNTYVFAELLQQPHIRSLAASPEHRSHHTLLELFAWGTWETYRAQRSANTVPELNPAQAEKLKLLSLLSIAAEHPPTDSTPTNLSYASLCARLDLPSPRALEQLLTTAIYANLLTGTLDPHAQSCAIASVAPLRDLAPGAAAAMLADLTAWEARCEAVLRDLQAEIAQVEARAQKRAQQLSRREKMVKAALEAGDKQAGAGSGGDGSGGKQLGRGAGKREANAFASSEELEDRMDVDESASGGLGAGGGKKRGAGFTGSVGRMGGSGGRSGR